MNNIGALVAWAPTFLRLVVGIVFFVHGAQKMWGWYGGPGLSGWVGFAATMGTPQWLAFLAAFAEFFGGIGLIFGLLTRLSALGIFCVMVVAVLKVHLAHGFFLNWFMEPNRGHGYEYSLTLLAAAVSIMLTGCGRLGLDNKMFAGYNKFLVWSVYPMSLERLGAERRGTMKAKLGWARVFGIVILAVLSLSCNKKSTSSTVGIPLPRNTVIIADFSFSPTPLNISVGDTVTWRNNGPSGHTVTSDTGNELNSALLGRGGVYTHIFNTAGMHDYHCAPHPFMRGRVVVQ